MFLIVAEMQSRNFEFRASICASADVLRRREASASRHQCLAPALGFQIHSYRRATRGSMRDARRAGMYPASIATLIIKAVAATRVTGSAAVKPKSWLEINFAAPITKGNPAATPI